MDSQDKRNRKISALVSVGAHAALLVAFFLMLAWVEPDPPIPEYGIELNFASVPANSSDANSDQPQEADVETSESSDPEVPDAENSNAEEVSEEETAESETQETIEEVQEAEATTEDINSPDVVEPLETEEQVIPGTEQNENKAESNTAEKSPQESQTDKEAEQKETQVIDERAIFKKSDVTGVSEGKGSSLELAGWNWDFLPEPDDQSSENGKIVFQIVIDDEGEIIGIKTLEKTVSPVVEKIYRDAVMELTFHKTADNKVAAANSTGKITFIIKSK